MDELLTTLVKVVAYITPFFLIPATFKFGLGVFGNLAGMVNDKSRGLFDRQRKTRSGIRQREFAKARAGERFNNRALNAFTSQATTGGLTPGRRRANYQQRMNNAAIAFSKSEQAQAIQHNDDALRALTYGSAVEARSNMGRDFGMNAQQIESSIAAARASGGFGRDRQVYAASQLSKTGTGYDNLEQVTRTIARASNGNTSQVQALAGDINSSTKAVGRNDLSPGFGTLNNLSQAEMADMSMVPGRQGFQNPTQRAAQYHTATRAAWNSADINTVVRGKGSQMNQFASHFRDIMADPGATEVHKRDAAIAIAEMHAALPGANAENQRYINDTMQQLGINYAPGSGPVEDQISALLAAQGIAMDGAEINGAARKYGSSVPLGAVAGGAPGGPGGAPPAGGGGTP